MAMTMRERCIAAMAKSKAWPVVFTRRSAARLLDDILAELENPTDEMLEEANIHGGYIGKSKFSSSLSAAIRAAREGK